MECRKCKRELPEDAVLCCYCGLSVIPKPRNKKRRGNGQGTVFPTKSGKWKAMVVVGRYQDENGKWKKKTVSRVFSKKSDAIEILPSLKNLPPETSDMTLHDLWEVYKNSTDYDALSSSQSSKMGYAWNRWTELEFRGIRTLTADDIENQISSKTTSYYPAHDMKVMLSHLYKIAIKKEIVAQNKTEYIDIPYETPKAKRECWTDDEVKLLWKDYEKHPFTGYLLIMCYAGLRYGELSTILLENIHLDENYMVGGIKTEAGTNREIPIHTQIKPILEKIIPSQKKKLLEMNDDNFYDAYWEVINRAGLRHLPPHTCRHYFFSKMTANGVQGGIIAEVGGHANYLTTLKNYVRIPLKDKLNAVNSINCTTTT